MSLSLKSLKSRSKKLFNNDLLTNLVIFISIALAVSYLTKRKYEALLLLVVIASVIQLIGKNLLYSLVISIILTNLLISSRVLKFREGMESQTQAQAVNNANAAGSSLQEELGIVGDVTTVPSVIPAADNSETSTSSTSGSTASNNYGYHVKYKDDHKHPTIAKVHKHDPPPSPSHPEVIST